MSTERTVIVAGAGCAGLAAASALDRDLPENWEIAVVDEHFDPPHTKTWCFWGQLPQGCGIAPSHHWDRAVVRAPGWERTDTLEHNRYARVDEAAYRAHHMDRLRRSRRIRWVRGRVAGVENLSHERAAVHLGTQTLVGRWVFQSVLRPDPLRAPQTSLLQHFGGWEVETAEPIFDPSTFTLMDFTVHQRGAVAFRYVLPTAPDRALVEHTVFSTTRLPRWAYDDELRAFLNARTSAYRIRRAEYGAIGMRDEVLPQRTGPCVYNLGSVGGLTKPTTGYTFLRIQQQVEALVSGLVRQGYPATLPEPAGRFGWYDRLLLRVLARSPQLGRQIFTRLFQGRPIESILSFLDERSTPLEEAKIFASLPWAPFIAAAMSNSHEERRALPATGGT